MIKCATWFHFVLIGYFHKDCTFFSVSIKEENITILFKCKSCFSRPINKKTVTINSSKGPTPQQPYSTLSHQRSLVQQGKQQHSLVNSQQSSLMQSSKCTPRNKRHSTPETGSDSSSLGCNTNKKSSLYGLKWMKNKDNNGADFRMKNLLLKGKPNTHHCADVICSYCSKPYHPELMYVRCEKCASKLLFEPMQVWFYFYFEFLLPIYIAYKNM